MKSENYYLKYKKLYPHKTLLKQKKSEECGIWS